jgi:hypothetical protein
MYGTVHRELNFIQIHLSLLLLKKQINQNQVTMYATVATLSRLLVAHPKLTIGRLQWTIAAKTIVTIFSYASDSYRVKAGLKQYINDDFFEVKNLLVGSSILPPTTN